jgi:hypothetical protein
VPFTMLALAEAAIPEESSWYKRKGLKAFEAS